MANVLLGATGSVAAVRVPALYDALTADGHAVKVVATDAATYFFDPAAVGAGGRVRAPPSYAAGSAAGTAARGAAPAAAPYFSARGGGGACPGLPPGVSFPSPRGGGGGGRSGRGGGQQREGFSPAPLT